MLGAPVSLKFNGCARTVHVNQLQPLFPDSLGGMIFFTSPSASAAAFSPSSLACSMTVSASPFIFSASALTVPLVEPLQPLACASFFTSAPPALLLEPLQPLPDAAPGSVRPPELIRPIAPILARIFLRSLFMCPPLEWGLVTVDLKRRTALDYRNHNIIISL